MFAITASGIDPEDPLAGLAASDRPEPTVPDGWTTVTVRAASLNQHDLWSLRGVGLRSEQLPMVLGCDAAGVDEDGNAVIVHSVIPGSETVGQDETLDPKRSLLSEVYDGTFAERVAVPRRNLVPKPEGLSFEEAACLPTAWLTAYRMLFELAQAQPGAPVLVQGAGGGVASALIQLGGAAGYRVYATSREEHKRARALELGAYQVLESGERLPERVDVVFDSVGQATWAHSLRSLRQGGRIVTCGATSGDAPSAELRRVFFLQLSIVGCTMGRREQLENLAWMCTRAGIRPEIDRVLPLSEASAGFAAMERGELMGKVVFTV
ncbi:zinc-binding dehydrogenase [Lipingzhangella sp. LS1_29]|uniref:Zinc-binding dehydrogenase n=1 Tax=Lipingzhangella rawalii TaxID=2055835 RepID=A0ABU2H9R5_9ACTN|nr:zinc-binding dehydrogenase [Lipingzhangella rawalii]MDS1272052.1 zinc-binding dehydrogenase [Lipingzhangella rawalii]